MPACEIVECLTITGPPRPGSIGVTPRSRDVRRGCRTRAAMAPGRNIVPGPTRAGFPPPSKILGKPGQKPGAPPTGTSVEYPGTRQLNSSGEEVADDSECEGDRRAAVGRMGVVRPASKEREWSVAGQGV